MIDFRIHGSLNFFAKAVLRNFSSLSSIFLVFIIIINFSIIFPEKLMMKKMFKINGILKWKQLFIKTKIRKSRKVTSFIIFRILNFPSNSTLFLKNLIDMYIQDNKNTMINGCIPLNIEFIVKDLKMKIMISCWLEISVDIN